MSMPFVVTFAPNEGVYSVVLLLAIRAMIESVKKHSFARLLFHTLSQ